MDQLTALRIFTHVADRGSFSAAADAMGLSKSAVSKHISALEDLLGVKLLYRTTRRVSLTDEGTAYLARVGRLLEDLDEADDAVRSLRAEPKGRLRVNAALSYGISHVAPALSEFCRRYPDLLVDLDLNDRFVDLVEEGYDVAVRIGELEDSALIARRLAPVQMGLVAAPAYFANHPRPALPEHLTDLDCLAYKGRRTSHEWRFCQDETGKPLSVRISGPLVCNNGDALRQAALDGLGIARLPNFLIADDVKSGRLEQILPDWPMPVSTVHAVYPQNRHLSNKVRQFVDFMVARIGHQSQETGVESAKAAE